MTIALDAPEIHLWYLVVDATRLPAKRSDISTLSYEEQIRAHQFHDEKDRVAYILARSARRQVLSCYVGESPEDLCFNVNSFGKPFLSQKENRWLRFNVSHCEGLILVAITRDREIGVDVESTHQNMPDPEIARLFLSTTEAEAFNMLPRAIQKASFFKLWTRHEAYIKAIGKGFSAAADDFHVSLIPEERVRLESTATDLPWRVYDVAFASDFAAAVAVESHEYEGSNAKSDFIRRFDIRDLFELSNDPATI